MKNKKKVICSFLIVIIFFLLAFFFIKHSSKKIQPKSVANIFVEIGGQRVKVDLAFTPTEQAQGLSGRKNLASDEGMLFVFNKPDRYSFWMKDMNFPIDIIWLAPSDGGEDSKMKVDYIKKDATPESYPETFAPSANDTTAKYVLEVSDGFSEKNNLKVGDNVTFSDF